MENSLSQNNISSSTTQIKLHPKCLDCGVEAKIQSEFQKRMAGVCTNFVVEFVCSSCYQKKMKKKNSIEFNKSQFNSDNVVVTTTPKFAKIIVPTVFCPSSGNTSTIITSSQKTPPVGKLIKLKKVAVKKSILPYVKCYCNGCHKTYQGIRELKEHVCVSNLTNPIVKEKIVETPKISIIEEMVNVPQNSIIEEMFEISSNDVIEEMVTDENQFYDDIIENVGEEDDDNVDFDDIINDEDKSNLVKRESPIDIEDAPQVKRQCIEIVSSIKIASVTSLNYEDSLPKVFKYFCMECNKLYPNLQSLKEHGHFIHNPNRASKTDELPYKCSSCELSFGKESLLKYHQTYEHYEFLCKYCGENLCSNQELQWHETRVHWAEINNIPANETFRCFLCSYTYGSYKILSEHIQKRHANDRVNKVKIRSASPAKPNAVFYRIAKDNDYCVLILNGKEYPYNFGEIIKKSQNNSELNQYHCSKCSKSFQTVQLLDEHLNNFKHDTFIYPSPSQENSSKTADTTVNKDVYSIEIGNPSDVIKTENSFENHNYDDENDNDDDKKWNYLQKVKEKRLPKFQCKHCFKQFQTQIMRDTHQHYMHKELNKIEYWSDAEKKDVKISKYECTVCSNQFLTKRRLVNHMTKYHRIPTMNYKCRVCTKEFQVRRFRINHEETDHRNPTTKLFHCLHADCTEKFSNIALLQGHLNVHNDSLPFVCELCGRGYSMQRYLHRHQDTHASEKRFKCEQCPLKFRYKSLLVKHHVTHSGNNKPHACSQCDKAYSDSRDLKRHVFEFHNTGEEKKFPCNLCSYSGYLETDLHRHLRNTHKIYQQHLTAKIRTGRSRWKYNNDNVNDK